MKKTLFLLTVLFSAQPGSQVFALDKICTQSELFYEKLASEKKHRPIGVTLSLVSNSPELTRTGTGTLIGESLIITARHVVEGYLKLVSEGHPAEFYFSPEGYGGNKAIQFNYVKVVEYRIGDTDWALIKISKPLGKTYGYYKLNNSNPEKLISDSAKVEISGYPRRCYSEEKDAVPVATNRCIVSGLDPWGEGLLLLDCASGSGMSGGPVFLNDKSSDGIIGIVVGQNGPDGGAIILPTTTISSEMKDLEKYPWKKIH